MKFYLTETFYIHKAKKAVHESLKKEQLQQKAILVQI